LSTTTSQALCKVVALQTVENLLSDPQGALGLVGQWYISFSPCNPTALGDGLKKDFGKQVLGFKLYS